MRIPLNERLPSFSHVQYIPYICRIELRLFHQESGRYGNTVVPPVRIRLGKRSIERGNNK